MIAVEKWCPKCKADLPVASFNKRGTGTARLQSWCRACQRRNHNSRRVEQPSHFMWSRTALRAAKRGRPFTLSEAAVEALLHDGQCYYCSRETEQVTGEGRGGKDHSASLDCVLPEQGYTVDNVVLACFRCNSIKSYGSSAEHRHIADRMDEHAARRAATDE